MKIFLIIVIVLVLAGIAGFIWLISFGIGSAMREKFPMDFVFFLQGPLNKLEVMGWNQTGYSNIGEDNPSVLLSKDDQELILTLKTKPRKDNGKITITLNDYTVVLDDIDRIEDIIYNLESKHLNSNNTSC